MVYTEINSAKATAGREVSHSKTDRCSLLWVYHERTIPWQLFHNKDIKKWFSVQQDLWMYY